MRKKLDELNERKQKKEMQRCSIIETGSDEKATTKI
jgi:hypothetical protein